MKPAPGLSSDWLKSETVNLSEDLTVLKVLKVCIIYVVAIVWSVESLVVNNLDTNNSFWAYVLHKNDSYCLCATFHHIWYRFYWCLTQFWLNVLCRSLIFRCKLFSKRLSRINEAFLCGKTRIQRFSMPHSVCMPGSIWFYAVCVMFSLNFDFDVFCRSSFFRRKLFSKCP